MQLWRLVSELTEQLAQNRAVTASLQAQAGSVNVRPSPGVHHLVFVLFFSLRRRIKALDLHFGGIQFRFSCYLAMLTFASRFNTHLSQGGQTIHDPRFKSLNTLP